MRSILDLERCTVRMPFCEIKFTVLLMNSLHQIQLSVTDCKFLYSLCIYIKTLWGNLGSVSQTERHNNFKVARVYRLLSKHSGKQMQLGSMRSMSAEFSSAEPVAADKLTAQGTCPSDCVQLSPFSVEELEEVAVGCKRL